MNTRMIAWILVSVLATTSAQILFKLEMSKPDIQSALASGSWARTIATVAWHPAVWLGLAMYGASAALWLYILGHVEVSRAYPFVGLGFALTAVLGALVLNEHVGTLRVAGTLLVCAGVYLVGRS